MKPENTKPWLQFGLRLLSFLEKILPAFLLVWNQSLRHKLEREKNAHRDTKHRLDVNIERAKTRSKYDGKNDRDVIDDFLAGTRESDRNDNN